MGPSYQRQWDVNCKIGIQIAKNKRKTLLIDSQKEQKITVYYLSIYVINAIKIVDLNELYLLKMLVCSIFIPFWRLRREPNL